jgi:hypothetical protein
MRCDEKDEKPRSQRNSSAGTALFNFFLGIRHTVGVLSGVIIALRQKRYMLRF